MNKELQPCLSYVQIIQHGGGSIKIVSCCFILSYIYIYIYTQAWFDSKESSCGFDKNMFESMVTVVF